MGVYVMENKNRRIQITLTEQEIATLEAYGVKSEVISDLIINHLETPAEWIPEEEKREKAPYKMYYDKGTLYLRVTYENVVEGWEYDDDGDRCWSTYDEEEFALLEYKKDEYGREGFVYCDEEDEGVRAARYVFKYFKDEIMKFAKTITEEQIVENGVLFGED